MGSYKKYLKPQKLCESDNCFDCWADGDKLYITGYFDGYTLPLKESKAFIDRGGRSWVLYATTSGRYLVDTNGFKAPNHFGKDRWYFALMGKDKKALVNGYPIGVMPRIKDDITSKSWACFYPPCYYKSWLLCD